MTATLARILLRRAMIAAAIASAMAACSVISAPEQPMAKHLPAAMGVRSDLNRWLAMITPTMIAARPPVPVKPLLVPIMTAQ